MNNTIFIYDRYGEVVDRFNDPHEMYTVLTSRYKALQKKRKVERCDAFWKGFCVSACLTDALIAIVFILHRL